MITFYSDDHKLHHGKCELIDGELKPCFEMPQRAYHVLEQVKQKRIGDICVPKDFGINPITKVHTKEYVDFLASAWKRYIAEGNNPEHDLLPFTWPARTLRHILPKENLHAELGYYSFDGGAPITAGTWQASYSSAQVALSAVQTIIDGKNCAFALCRPPGHHAAADLMGGYCFLNNIAIAAQSALDQDLNKIAILDIDYHHGNGTQSIFYERSDVFFTSIHGDPSFEFPFFLGFSDETGINKGEDFNLNLPLTKGSDWSLYLEALNISCNRIIQYNPDILMVSLGVDTFENDPISLFKLKSDDYLKIGEKIAQINKPTLFVMEGGYAVKELGINAVNVLEGFLSI